MRKTAIAIPEDVLKEVDRAARARGESRSRFITETLKLALRKRRDVEITARLDAVLRDADLVDSQRREAERWASLSPLEDERW